MDLKLGDIVMFTDGLEHKKGKFRIVANHETSCKWIEDGQYLLECVEYDQYYWVIDTSYVEYLKSPLVELGMKIFSEYGCDYNLKSVRVLNTNLARVLYPDGKVSECGEWLEVH